jgi:NADH:ubiquinone reductase (H+-translocating)
MSFDIVIVGGGFGGLEAAFTLRTLMGESASITLIDRQAEHSFLPSIHEVSTGKIAARSIQIPLKTVLAPAGIHFIQDDVSTIDTTSRQVSLADGELRYDCLLLATGAENNFFDVPGAERFSFRFRTSGDALRIRDSLERLLAEARKDVHLVIAGGGTEGVEVAGELLDLNTNNNASITVIEGQQQLLPGFPAALGGFAAKYLQEKGVSIVTAERITTVREDSLILSSGRVLPQSILIWSGGIKPSGLINGLDLPKDPDGWLIVDAFLRTPADERIYVVGDAATIKGLGNALSLPKLAYLAQEQATVAALNIASFLQRSGDLVRYEARTRPQLISIGKNMGIYAFQDTFRTGAWVVGLKKAVERKHMMSYLSRPLITGIARNIPGSSFLIRLGLKLPF